MNDTKVFGFWIYLMTDLVVFAVLFAAFAILRDSTFGGPSACQLFSMPIAFTETLLLLVSSFTCSLATLAVHRHQKNWVVFWFIATFLLGAAFLVLELREFSEFIHQGANPERSGFLSSFFTLVGTHGLHITVGLLWMLAAIVRTALREISEHDVSRLYRLAFFWHFLDVVWVFIFTDVYAVGHLCTAH